eukprot:5029405-Pyramimonas_sp.AAC.1
MHTSERCQATWPDDNRASRVAAWTGKAPVSRMTARGCEDVRTRFAILSDLGPTATRPWLRDSSIRLARGGCSSYPGHCDAR